MGDRSKKTNSIKEVLDSLPTGKISSHRKYLFLKQHESTLSDDEVKMVDEYEKEQLGTVKFEIPEKVIKEPVIIKAGKLAIDFIKEFEKTNKRPLIIADDEKWFYIEMMMYFSKHERFGSKGKSLSKFPSLEKGILIMGKAGVGKSTLFNVINSLSYKNLPDTTLWFTKKSMLDINDEYMVALNNKCQDEYIKNLVKIKTLYIDDLGTEKKIFKDYIFTEIYEHRYNAKNKTHITTNLDSESLESRYGFRVVDRMREFQNIFIHPRMESFRGTF